MDILNRLSKLEEIARQAEAKAQANKLANRKREIGDRLQAAEQRAAVARKRLRDEGATARKKLSTADEGEQRLKELTRKLAQFHSHLDSTTDIEAEVRSSREEIEQIRKQAKAELEAIEHADAESRKELREALEQFHELEREQERLQLHGGQEDEIIVRAAESHFLGRKIESLAREIEDAVHHFGMLDTRQQKAQLTIWVGRFRQLQDRLGTEEAEDVTEEQERTLERTFPSLVGISKRYMPGYIEAFRESYVTDWDEYIAMAHEQLLQATDDASRHRQVEARLTTRQAEGEEVRRLNREEGLKSLDELRAVIAGPNFPDENADAFREVLAKAILNLGAADADVLRLTYPFRDLLTDGREFRALRRHLERGKSGDGEETNGAPTGYEDVAAVTAGMRGVIIGGAVREDARRNLESVLDFDQLEWIPYESHRPVAIGGLERSIRNHGVDVVLILKDFIGHHVTEKLRPLCEQFETPCLMVDHGYGVGQVAEALRRGLIKNEASNANGAPVKE